MKMAHPQESLLETARPLGAAAPMSRRYFNLSADTVRLLLCGSLLPNALSLATLLSVIDIGLPPRSAVIILYGIVALCARRLPFGLTCLLFAAVLAFDLVWTISLMFGLAPDELMAALEHVRRVNLLASPLYVGLIVAIGCTTIISLQLMSQRTSLVRGNAYVLFVAVLLMCGVDAISNTSAHFRFNAMFGHDQPVVSAADLSGFRAVAGANGRNVVLVMVESLGYVKDPESRQRIASPLSDPRIVDKYVVTSGRAGYFGATTAGEMRELCDTRTPYKEVAVTSGADCLPSKLRHLGYTTLAFHGFSSEMFSRRDWYPDIGFSKTIFGEDLGPRTKRMCGDAFRGVCDADLPPLIAKHVASTNAPHFIYWLTLNTHIPVPPGDALTNFNCEKGQNVFITPRVCRMAELWHDVFASVAQLALDPAIGPAEILVVGDHAPPLWSKRGRGQFEPGQVAWYRLTPRDGKTALR